MITAINNKFNYIRAAIYSSGSATWIKTSGPPGAGDGADGNYCIDTVNFHAYGPKTAGAWGSPIAIGGATAFLTGSGAPSSGLGVNGNLYLDTVSGLLYGPKAGGAWGSGTAIAGTKLGAIGALTWDADQLIYLTGTATVAATSLTSFVRGLLGSANAAAFRTGLGLGDSATRNIGTTAGTVCAGDDSRLSGGGLPSQTGNAGKILTTDGTNPGWENTNNVFPSQTGLAGKFLTTNGSAVSWGTPSGGGGGGSSGFPDTPPSSPSQWDDEFDSATLNAKWTPAVFDGETTGQSLSVFTSSYYNINTTLPSCLYVSLNSWATPSRSLFNIGQQFSPSGSFTIVAKFRGTGMMSYNGPCIYICDAGKTNGMRFSLENEYSGATIFATISRKDNNSWTFNCGKIAVADTGVHFIMIYYLSDSSTFGLSISHDGYCWTYVGSLTKSFAVANLNVTLRLAGGSAAVTQAIDWIRVNTYTYPF